VSKVIPLRERRQKVSVPIFPRSLDKRLVHKAETAAEELRSDCEIVDTRRNKALRHTGKTDLEFPGARRGETRRRRLADALWPRLSWFHVA